MSDANSPAEVDRKDHFFHRVDGSFAVFGAKRGVRENEDWIRLDRLTYFGPDPFGSARRAAFAEVGSSALRLGYVDEKDYSDLLKKIEAYRMQSVYQAS